MKLSIYTNNIGETVCVINLKCIKILKLNCGWNGKRKDFIDIGKVYLRSLNY